MEERADIPVMAVLDKGGHLVLMLAPAAVVVAEAVLYREQGLMAKVEVEELAYKVKVQVEDLVLVKMLEVEAVRAAPTAAVKEQKTVVHMAVVVALTMVLIHLVDLAAMAQ